MKKIKFLLMLALVLTVLTTVAFAADSAVVSGAVNNEISYEGTGNLTVSVVANAAYETDSPYATIVFDHTKWTVASPKTGITGGTAVINAMTGEPTMSYLDMASLAEGDVIISAVFTPIEGQNVDGSEFKITATWYDADTYDLVETDAVVYTVKTASQKTEPSCTSTVEKPGQTITAGDVQYLNVFTGEYTFDPGDYTITKVYVTYGDNKLTLEKGGLNISGESGAKVTFKTAILGVTADDTITSTPGWVVAD